jgi:hypothetical protein
VNDPAVVVAPDRVAVDFDDERLVADAGIVLRRRWPVVWVDAPVDRALDLGHRVGAARLTHGRAAPSVAGFGRMTGGTPAVKSN